jgi:hypothetical protein
MPLASVGLITGLLQTRKFQSGMMEIVEPLLSAAVTARMRQVKVADGSQVKVN